MGHSVSSLCVVTSGPQLERPPQQWRSQARPSWSATRLECSGRGSLGLPASVPLCSCLWHEILQLGGWSLRGSNHRETGGSLMALVTWPQTSQGSCHAALVCRAQALSKGGRVVGTLGEVLPLPACPHVIHGTCCPGSSGDGSLITWPGPHQGGTPERPSLASAAPAPSPVLL